MKMQYNKRPFPYVLVLRKGYKVFLEKVFVFNCKDFVFRYKLLVFRNENEDFLPYI